MKCPECHNKKQREVNFYMGCVHDLISSSTSSPHALSCEEQIDKIQRYVPKGLIENLLAQRGKIKGERKQITVMSCTMERFTPLVETILPEKAYSIIDEVHEIHIYKVHD